jgi:hypothetical protein
MGETTARVPLPDLGVDDVPEGFSNPNFTAVPVPALWPDQMRELFDAALTARWERTVYYGRDINGHPFFTVYAYELPVHRARSVVACWHTRGGPGGLPPGPYRLVECTLYGPGDEWREVTLLWALAVLRTAHHAEEAHRA